MNLLPDIINGEVLAKSIEPTKSKKIRKERKKREHQPKKVSVKGQFKECPKCHNLMDRRFHTEISKKLLQKAFYFTEWDYCRGCRHMQHYDEFKKWNKNEKATYAQGVELEKEFTDRINN